MSSSDLFVIGSSGLRSMRAQMGAISDNIANANTLGYNRRTVLLQESSVSASSEPLYVPRASFGGSEIVGVNRANDLYLDATARQTGMALGYANSRVRWLADIETAIGDDALGVGGTLNTMYASIDKLSASPSDTGESPPVSGAAAACARRSSFWVGVSAGRGARVARCGA